jgi:DNA-binding NtrC family response regulator
MKIPGLIRKGQPARAVETGKADVSREVATILLVEDDDAVRGFAQLALAGSGYRVFSCASGEEALLLESECSGTIDLLLTDIVMPGLSGIEVANLLAAKRPGVQTILMSGYPPENFTPALTATHAFIAKPFLVGTLVSMVRETLNKQSRIDAAVDRALPGKATREIERRRVNAWSYSQ